MLMGYNISFSNVVEIMKYLGENPKHDELKTWLMGNIKHKVNTNKDGKIMSYDFDRQELWDKLFSADKKLSMAMENKRIDSLERLEYSVLEYLENHSGRHQKPTVQSIDDADEMEKQDECIYG